MKTEFERILAHYVAKIIPDLRLVDVQHYIYHLYHGHYANIAEIVEAATELYFFPQTLRFADAGDFQLKWKQPPVLLLNMEFFNKGVRLAFCLNLRHDRFAIELERIRFGSVQDVETSSSYSDSQRLISALNDACLRKTL